MGDISEIKPLIAESSTSESTTVEVVMNALRDKDLDIPDYQRDSDQWSEETKSLLVESVINNLSIPAFFFEVAYVDSIEKNLVIDGQQRLTTLFAFFDRKFRMVPSEDAPYISPNSVHYAGKTFDELPPAYQSAFRKYRLAIIKLRNLGDMKLEVFRRINQGGTPLSGQDIRLAYYGSNSSSLALIRLAGIYDSERPGARRFLETAKTKFALDYPWKRETAKESWREWWAEKDIARGQAASEMFLWGVVASQAQQLDSLLTNEAALQTLKIRFNRAIDEALDACCAQLKYQDQDTSIPPILMPFEELRGKFFLTFEEWIDILLGQKGPSLPVTKHRMVASIIGSAYRLGVSCKELKNQQWTDIVEFIRKPQELAKKLGLEMPQSRGRWDGKKGYRAQFEAISSVLKKIVS